MGRISTLRVLSVLSLVTAWFIGAGASLGGVTPALASGPPSFVQVCPGPQLGYAGCMAIRVDGTKQPGTASSIPSGYGPSQLQSAYNLAASSSGAGAGETVAVVDAYDDPTALSDLCTYRSTYSLPALKQCAGGSTASPTFTKVNQTGGTSYPRANSNWAQEISLDLDMVSAICPNCNILLVEASSSSLSNLGQGVNTAAKLGPVAISNSYGGSESSTETNSDSYYNHPGIAVTASSGDSGYGAQYPAASPYVTAVGGTTLNSASNLRGWTESAWTCSGTFSCKFFGGAGSGCSQYEAKPTWQTDTGCARRTIADISAVADPSTGVAVYYNGGWTVFGGTSVASPIIASVFALAGGYSSNTNPNPAVLLYNHPSSLNDVTSSDAKVSCSPDYLCNAAPGYDGPTGLGTPNGTGAF